MDHLSGLGIKDVVLGVVPGNPAATLYERAGFRVSWTYLTRFERRDVAPSSPAERDLG